MSLKTSTDNELRVLAVRERTGFGCARLARTVRESEGITIPPRTISRILGRNRELNRGRKRVRRNQPAPRSFEELWEEKLIASARKHGKRDEYPILTPYRIKQISEIEVPFGKEIEFFNELGIMMEFEE